VQVRYKGDEVCRVKTKVGAETNNNQRSDCNELGRERTARHILDYAHRPACAPVQTSHRHNRTTG
jgi:hypothetical protein